VSLPHHFMHSFFFAKFGFPDNKNTIKVTDQKKKQKTYENASWMRLIPKDYPIKNFVLINFKLVLNSLMAQ